MGKSYRHDSYYRASGAKPSEGKRYTSRELRRMAKDNERKAAELLLDHDFYVDDPRDSSRGDAGSKDADYGWKYFGDGRISSGNKKGRK